MLYRENMRMACLCQTPICNLDEPRAGFIFLQVLYQTQTNNISKRMYKLTTNPHGGKDNSSKQIF